jgi:hypothetical protein
MFSPIPTRLIIEHSCDEMCECTLEAGELRAQLITTFEEHHLSLKLIHFNVDVGIIIIFM